MNGIRLKLKRYTQVHIITQDDSQVEIVYCYKIITHTSHTLDGIHMFCVYGFGPFINKSHKNVVTNKRVKNVH